jgi:hypothetical protein
LVGGKDCNSPRTETVNLNKFNFKGWVGGFYLVDGKPVELNAEDKDMMGKTVQMRVPQYCTQDEGNLCYTCCGKKLGAIKYRVSSEAVYIFTQFMLTRMKAMHVSQLKTITMTLDQIVR